MTYSLRFRNLKLFCNSYSVFIVGKKKKPRRGPAFIQLVSTPATTGLNSRKEASQYHQQPQASSCASQLPVAAQTSSCVCRPNAYALPSHAPVTQPPLSSRILITVTINHPHHSHCSVGKLLILCFI